MPRGKTNTPERFWQRIDQSGECWIWQGSRYPTGYGHLSYMGQRDRYAHRVAFELTYGPIPEKFYVCHRCDNPPCCRPEHLFLGTPRENTQDAMSKGRRAVAPPRKPVVQVRQGLARQWSPLRPACVDCGESSRPYMAHGQCSRCYLASWKRRRKGVAA